MATGSVPVIGIDVGSTTVKCTVVDPATLAIRWSRYQRHEARQAQMLAQMLEAAEAEYPALKDGAGSAFITGSGAGPLAEAVGACFVQEVNAVTLAVEHLHPEVRSVIELGGQDAKIILFQDDPVSGARRVITSMNDKCASGTGATLDKCLLKTGMSHAELTELHFDPERLHHVAAKCGVFAETDTVNLIKAGVPPGEVMNSLADAIVMQNLSVLARGNTLQAQVLLLGGPNAYLPFLQAAWRLRIPQTWTERDYTPPDGKHPETCIRVPDNAQYYAAFGAVVFGVQATGEPLAYRGAAGVRTFIRDDRRVQLGKAAGPGLLTEGEDLEVFRQQYQVPVFNPPALPAGTRVGGYIGLDGGSTSSKAVLIDEQGELLAKTYRLSQGNPIVDARMLLAQLRDQVSTRGCQLEVLGFGATGYAADVLDQALCADANLVETVAHMMSAQRYYGDDVDVICDIGGQDIKVLFLQNGVIKSFRLSNQCSAGNGMLLQAMADQFGVALQDFADIAFKARLAPRFSYGCAVFLDADRVNFQKEGFSREEMFA
ncbi:MAG TPA: CoA activase, partial [Chromatiales bacterium]|nr:CoA activase [Chromatiales bacterium]HEX21928.1 CoA activase [Chromatiales bacterium]